MSKELKVDARILRNDIVRKAAVANMTNIAKQRADLKQGIIATPPDTKSATEISEDRTVQAADALKNLIDLGFKDSDAQSIASDLTHEQRVAFNRAYPQIQNDFSSRFSVRNSTPEFFIEYLKNYLRILKATGGIPNSIGYLQDNIVTTPTDLLKLILTSEYIERLRDILTNDYGLSMLDNQLNATLDDLAAVLPSSQVIADLNQAMISDPVLGFESIQDILQLLTPLPSKKVIQKILDEPHSTAAQKTQIRIDLLEKLDVLENNTYYALPAIYRDLAAAAAPPPPVPVIGAPPPLGGQPVLPLGGQPAPVGVPPVGGQPAPVGAPPVGGQPVLPVGGQPVLPVLPVGQPLPRAASPPPAAAVSSSVLTLPKRTARTALLLISNFTNPINRQDYDVYLYKYTDKGATLFGLILEPLVSGASSSPPRLINKWGIDGSEMAALFARYNYEISNTASGTSFNISALGNVDTASLTKLLDRVSKSPAGYRTRTFSTAEMSNMTNEIYEAGKAGFGLKSKSKPTSKPTTGLKPIRLGKGFKNKDDPYTMYDEELKLTPINPADVVKKPPKKPAHKVSEGIDGDEYQKFDDKANRYIALGKYAVNMRQLKKGVLQIVYKSLAPMQTFPSKKISSELQQYLFELLTNQKSLPALYKHVPEEDKKMFEKIAIFAGVFDKLNLPRVNSLEDEKKEMDRFKLLHGEFIAGNDNVAIARELRSLILKFLADNRISKAKAYEYLLELNNA